MQELAGDIWGYWQPENGDWLGITTNSYVNKDRKLTMGKGFALEARQRFPKLPEEFGSMYAVSQGKQEITFPHLFTPEVRFLEWQNIFSFPTKKEWWLPAKSEIIDKSCEQLKRWIEFYDKKGLTDKKSRFLLVRPGCGAGNLPWFEVRSLLMEYFATEDRLVIVDRRADETKA